MRRRALILIFLAALWASACENGGLVEPATKGTLEVYVYYQDQGLEDKQLEILELGLERRTNAAGLAYFSLPAGEYTLRAYEINRGGPCCAYFDQGVTVEPGEETRIEIHDCITCD